MKMRYYLREYKGYYQAVGRDVSCKLLETREKGKPVILAHRNGNGKWSSRNKRVDLGGLKFGSVKRISEAEASMILFQTTRSRSIPC